MIIHQDFRCEWLFPIFAAIKPWGSSIHFKKHCDPCKTVESLQWLAEIKLHPLSGLYMFFCICLSYLFICTNAVFAVNLHKASKTFALRILWILILFLGPEVIFSKCPLHCSVVGFLNGSDWLSRKCGLVFTAQKSPATQYCAPTNVNHNGVHFQIPKKPTPAGPHLQELVASSREWETFRPPDHSETQLFFLLASAERKEIEAGKWSWREPGRSKMRRASLCYRNGKRWRDKAHVKDTGNEKALQYFQPLVPSAHKDIAWPWQMELHMLAVKPHQTCL